MSSSQLPSLSALEVEAHRLQTEPPTPPGAPVMGIRQVREPEVDMTSSSLLLRTTFLHCLTLGRLKDVRCVQVLMACRLPANVHC